MKTVSVHDAIGLTLCHDITEIVPGKTKGPLFRRGHIVKAEDIPVLLRLGKENLYVWDSGSDDVHEDEAAVRIAKAVSGDGIEFGKPKEGKINFVAKQLGFLQIDRALLLRINSIPSVTLATIHAMQTVKPGRIIAGTRVIPLAVPESTIAAVEECCNNAKLFSVIPFKSHAVGIVTTGSEVFKGRIKDAFGPVLHKKFNELGCSVLSQTIVPDETPQTIEAIEQAIANGASMVVVSGGMSVDPDDKTPAAIKAIATEVVCYGVPVLPGAMFMLGYRQSVPILGLPGCVMYHKTSIFDLVVPRILARIRITKNDILNLAYGGFCESCPECRYPACGFGK
ncbi:molybdopterin-binding protein [Desulfovibrio litoralis]|uniref:Molybdopterin molybdenumtransferase n=1 Tax=Desulfovibrio litoralis DSM 11393 TaxID=1121455 RepID=A0A1M7TJ64_9BACT|nr:molybdopterin-binding protein [Desulfovibrio litoralis]SHN70760.1 molybdenum cofactor synthesis domain-containing protein [Desulfovibrio litoralis DSM 11393]